MNTFAAKEKLSSPVPRTRSQPSRFGYRNPEMKNQQTQIHNILLSTGTQAKLEIGQPNDKYEHEADRVADQVMKMSDVDVAQREPEEDEEKLQAKEAPGQTPVVSSSLESKISNLKGGGKPLDPDSRAFFEPRFGHDFGGVRIHADSAAAETAGSIHSRAFTLGNHIAMGHGEYRPQSPAGRHLLGHELTHVVQQTGKIQRYRKKGSFNYGMADKPPDWVEQPFKSVKKQPWIQKIIITLNAKKSDSDGHDTWLGNLKVIYYKNKVALTDFSIPVSGGSIQVGRTDAGTFTVHRIEGQNYNSGTYSGNLIGGVGPRGRYTRPPGTMANMHLAVFYNRGEAIHVGPVGESSHGCVHVDSSHWGKMRQINYHSVIGKTKIIVKYQKPSEPTAI
jgi:hypothetical protein